LASIAKPRQHDIVVTVKATASPAIPRVCCLAQLLARIGLNLPFMVNVDLMAGAGLFRLCWPRQNQ